MTDANIYSDVITGIVALLRANITDPDTARSGAGRNFIYDRFPHKTASMPRISVTVLPHGDTEELDLGEDDELITLQVQIDVWVDRKSTFTIASATYNGGKLQDYLSGQVSKVMKKNKATLTANNIHIVSRSRPFGDMDSGFENLIRSLGEYEIGYHQTYT